MKKFVSAILMACLILTAFWIVPAVGEYDNINVNDAPQESRGSARNTLYVGSGQTYTKIQDAIDNASAGDTIRVYDGIYLENIVLDKPLSIIGNGSNNTILDAANWTDIVSIKADGCKISNMQITDGELQPDVDCICGSICIDIRANNTVIEECTISDGYNSIYLKGNNNKILNCTLFHSWFEGIYLMNSDNNEISGCSVTMGGKFGSGGGIYSIGSNYNSIINSDISYNSYGGIELNGINNSILDCRIDSNNDFGINIGLGSGNLITHNNIVNHMGLGMNIKDLSHHNLIYQNNFINNSWGIYNLGVQAEDWGLNNRWNTSSEGNYWSDYTRRYPNASNNGEVWDTPYDVTGIGAKDHFPLVNPPVTSDFPPEIITKNIKTAYVGELYLVNYSARDFDTPQNQLTWDMTTNASFLTFTSAHQLSGKPTIDDLGSYDVLITVTDGKNTDATNFTLTVKNRGQKPPQPPPGNGTVVIVRTGQKFIKIQDAIDNATSGDTIRIYSKIYKEDILITKRLTLIGENKYTTILEANDTVAMEVRSWQTNISGLTIRNSEVGVFLDGAIWSFDFFDINIYDCVFTNNKLGIRVMYERGFSVSNCVFQTNIEGIELKSSYNGQIEKCSFENNTGYAIDILGGNSSSNYITIWNNTFMNNNGATSKYNISHIQARDDVYKFFRNTWNSTDGFGNYWSDWLTPDNNKDGIVDLPYNLTGTAGSKDYRPLTNYVPPVTYPPKIITPDNPNAYEGTRYSVNYTATDQDTPNKKLTWHMHTNASWLSFSSTQELYGTPSSTHVGSYWVNIEVTDGEYNDKTNFTLTVHPKQKQQENETVKVIGTSIGNASYNVSVNTTEIIITFSNAIDQFGVEQALSISPRINYTLVWENNSTVLRLMFTEKFSYNTTYSITIDPSVIDGYLLESLFRLEFHTEEESKGDVPSNGNGNGHDESWITFDILMVITLIIIFLLVLSFITRSKRIREQQSVHEAEEHDEILVTNGLDEIIYKLKKESLGPTKSSEFGISRDEMLTKFRKKYEKGQISKQTYEVIRRSLSNQKP
jgi:parallel beta-helix repeat protein